MKDAAIPSNLGKGLDLLVAIIESTIA